MRGIEQVEEELNEVVEIIAETSGKHEDTLREYIYYIVTLALSQGVTPKFTFSSNPSLDEKVNKKLVELSDAIKDVLDTQVNNAINVITDISADDIESAVEYVNRAIDGEDIISRIDSYHSELKYILEAYIAAGIYKGLSVSEIVQEYMIWKDSPLSSPTIREAMKHPIDFATPLILSLGFSFGSGLYRSTLANYKRLSSYTIAEAYNYGALQTMRGNSKVVGYKTVRNSSYPCQVCDDLTMVVHPLDSLVVPAHPRCVCGIYPVYIDDLTEESKIQFKAYSSSKWDRTYFHGQSGGYVVTSKERIAASKVNKNELDKFNKEQRMCKILAQSGYRIEHLSEISGISSPDVTINGINADLKSLSSANNIIRHAKKATRKQGAKLVVFEFNRITPEIRKEITHLIRLNIHGLYFDKSGVVHKY